MPGCVAGRRSVLLFVQGLTPEQDPRRSHVVSDVDQQERQIAAPPQKAGKHDQPADLAEQCRNRVPSLCNEAGHDFGQQ